MGVWELIPAHLRPPFCEEGNSAISLPLYDPAHSTPQSDSCSNPLLLVPIDRPPITFPDHLKRLLLSDVEKKKSRVLHLTFSAGVSRRPSAFLRKERLLIYIKRYVL